MADVYLISTLKNEWNRAFNPLLCSQLEARDISVHLPQRDTNQQLGARDKCSTNLAALSAAKKVLAVGMNESINWGIEVGYASGLGKQVIGLTANNHDVDNGQNIPVMCTKMVSQHLADDLHDFDSYIAALVEALRK